MPDDRPTLFGWIDPGTRGEPIADVRQADVWSVPDEVGTLPAFPETRQAPTHEPMPCPSCGATKHAADSACGWKGGSWVQPATRQAPEPDLRCDMPIGDDDDPTECGKRAVVVYVSPAGAEYPRCRNHDTVAAQRRAVADGYSRREHGGS